MHSIRQENIGEHMSQRYIIRKKRNNELTMTVLLIFVISMSVIIGIFIVSLYLAVCSEVKDWNGGYCPQCGEKLRHFGCDSQGGDVWCCDACDYITWVSYYKLVYRTARKEEVHIKEFTPLESKLKEIIDSYNDGRAITHEDVIFYADILRRELYKEMQLESKKEEK